MNVIRDIPKYVNNLSRIIQEKAKIQKFDLKNLYD